MDNDSGSTKKALPRIEEKKSVCLCSFFFCLVFFFQGRGEAPKKTASFTLG